MRDWCAHSKIQRLRPSFQHSPLPGRSVACGWAQEFGFSTSVLAVESEPTLYICIHLRRGTAGQRNSGPQRNR